jgi:hypothetical protein
MLNHCAPLDYLSTAEPLSIVFSIILLVKNELRHINIVNYDSFLSYRHLQNF